MASISLVDVGKVYANGFEALRQLSLDVAEGEFLVLVGPSGCGKTTALRMVAGLETVTRGTIRIGERIVNDVAPKDRDVAMVFQNYALYPHMSVADNMGYALRMRKVPRAEIRRRVNEAGTILGLTPWLGSKPGRLSGGQRQRVAMGRAIVREPAAFLMDEPLSNLDAKLRVQMRAEVLRIQRRIGVSTVYVTHDQVEAMTMGDRVAVLRAGELQQCDRPQVVYDRPANVFVAAFIGSPAMNLFRATLDGDGALMLGGYRHPLSGEALEGRAGLRAYRDRPIIVGVRPEDLSLEQANYGGPSLRGEVELVEALGSEQLVHFRTDAPVLRVEDAVVAAADAELESGTVSIADAVARVDPRRSIEPGSRIELTLRDERLHFFDPESGRSI